MKAAPLPPLRDPHVRCPACNGTTTAKSGETKKQTQQRHLKDRPMCRAAIKGAK